MINIYTDEEKSQKIKKVQKKLEKLFKNSDEKDKKLIRGLTERAAFMEVTLQELEEDIKKEGCIEEYQNGANQKGVKKSSKVEVYNTMSKNYASIIKQLQEMLNRQKAVSGDEFTDF